MNKFSIPNLGLGIGFRHKHYEKLLSGSRNIKWLEVITDNYIGNKINYEILQDLQNQYPLVMHGVCMSVGSTDPIDFKYLQQVKWLASKINPEWISDHICFTGVNNFISHDLLPIPYSKESLSHITERVKIIQDYLERPIILENPSTYIEFDNSNIPEYEFINLLAENSGCGILLDINNIYVSCFNNNTDPYQYLDNIDMKHIVQNHLSGHKNYGDHIIDTHDDHVTKEVYDLYKYFCKINCNVSCLVEWDSNIPELEVLENELDKVADVIAISCKNKDKAYV
jgi:uncharacterized protein